MSHRTSASAFFLLIPAILACGKHSSQVAADSARAAQAGTVATMDGLTLTAADLEEKAKGRLQALKQEEYEARKSALDDMLGEKLLEREAAARGTTPDGLFNAEVNDRVAAPGPLQVRAFYEANKGRMGGRSFAVMEAEITKFLRSEGLDARRAAFRKELSQKYNVRVFLEPPRYDVRPPATAIARGPANAKVTMVEFTDYQCPYCQKAEHTVQSLLSQYESNVRFVMADFPLEGHPGAFPAARAARCAGEQGKFWELHRDLLTMPGDFSERDFKTRAQSLGLKADEFSSCLASTRHDAAINESRDAGIKLGVQATPTFFINGRMVSGARPVQDFQEILDDEISRAGH